MTRDRKDERGFALLLVFAMAAAIAIMMYMELPRAAFEAQRGKEEMLIERGEQYQRGIELYVRKFKKYPRDLDELEKQAGVHFLRQRYKDPLTNSDEWRLIHIDNMGRFTDSLVYKQKSLNDKDKKDYQNTFISEGAAIGTTSVGSSTGANLANRRRASDAPGAPGTGTGQQIAEGVAAVTAGSDPNAPPNAEGQAAQPGQPGQQSQPGAAAIDPVTGQPIETPQGQKVAQGQQPGQLGQQPGQGQPGQPNQPNQFPPVGLPIPGQQPNAAQPAGAGPNSPQNASNPALQAIQQSLTNPQQAGTASQTAQSGQQAPGAQMGTGVAIPGGLAGVASKLESDSIKIYGDRQKYNEWEFVYDMNKKKGQGQGQGQQGNQNALQPGGSNTPNSSSFGSNSGFGNSNNANQNPNP
jgi:hypothetical protein